MIVLALDTATPPGSCAVARDGRVVRVRAGDPQLSHAERLPLDLMRVLDEAAIALHDVDAFAVAIGPGSFTGLRVGIAAMQGLAFAVSKPLFGVSALDALAVTAGGGRVAAWIDAWRGEVYAALYEHGQALAPPTVALPDELLERYPPSPILFIGDGAAVHWARIEAHRHGLAALATPATPLIAGPIAELAAAAAARGEHPTADEIRPLYVRRSDAERARDARPVG